MRTKSPRAEVTGGGEKGETIDHAGRVRIANGETGVQAGGKPPVRIGQRHKRGRPVHKASRAEIHPPARIPREWQTDPVGAGMNRFRIKSNRQPSKWIFCPRNALSRKSSNKSSRGTPLILYLA